MVFSAGTTSRRDLLMASSVAASSAHAASASARSEAALAAASFLGLRRRGGDAVRAPSRMTRAPLLRRGADAGSYLTVLGVDAEDCDADLVADPEEPDVIRRGIQELPRRRESVGRGSGGISRTGSLPRSMCSRTNSSVRLGALHQRRRPAALLRARGGGGPS
jgi:hypothetical protein